jgi:hypothetical protein
MPFIITITHLLSIPKHHQRETPPTRHYLHQMRQIADKTQRIIPSINTRALHTSHNLPRAVEYHNVQCTVRYNTKSNPLMVRVVHPPPSQHTTWCCFLRLQVWQAEIHGADWRDAACTMHVWMDSITVISHTYSYPFRFFAVVAMVWSISMGSQWFILAGWRTG